MQRSAVIATLMVIAGCLALSVCSEKNEAKPSPISGLPVTLKLKQRSTATVPGSGDKLTITIDDITSGQVMVSMAEGGAPLLGVTSLAEGKSVNFTFAGSPFTLRLTSLENALVGDDFVTFTIGEPGEGGDAAKIEKLIAYVEGLKDIVFARNGTDHSPSDAAKFLRHKYNSMGPSTTAEQFIEQAGTKSSTSGQPYTIRFPDGKTVPSADFLREKLKEIAPQ